MAGGEIYQREDFIHALEIDESDLRSWEDMGLLAPAGKLDGGSPFYSEASVKEARQILQLSSLGYDLEGIQKIVRKVGLPRRRERKGKDKQRVLLTVGQLAEATGLNARTIKYWEEKGIILPDGRSVGGFRLYSPQTVELCTLVRDLQNFGYSLEEISDAAGLIRDFNAISNGADNLTAAQRQKRLAEMELKLGVLEERISSLRDGIKRWEQILRRQRREINQHLQKAKAARRPTKKSAPKGKQSKAKGKK
jgi:DNA-binding transcriptional MerR regulator